MKHAVRRELSKPSPRRRAPKIRGRLEDEAGEIGGVGHDRLKEDLELPRLEGLSARRGNNHVVTRIRALPALTYCPN